jgi:hypothetical protein
LKESGLKPVLPLLWGFGGISLGSTIFSFATTFSSINMN